MFVSSYRESSGRRSLAPWIVTPRPSRRRGSRIIRTSQWIGGHPGGRRPRRTRSVADGRSGRSGASSSWGWSSGLPHICSTIRSGGTRRSSPSTSSGAITSGFLRPLDYGQVCPILFLWCELTSVKMLGFSEWSLTSVPAALRPGQPRALPHRGRPVVPGPLLLAVAIFAVSVPPDPPRRRRQALCSDLLVALGSRPAVEWWRLPDRAGGLWRLAAFVPIALLSSHPAIFVAGGVGLAILVPRDDSSSERRLAFVAYGFVASELTRRSTFYSLDHRRPPHPAG